MSLTGDRQAIADALSTVTGVTGYPYKPTTPKPGDAWPLLRSLDREDGLMFAATWTVVVNLPQTERAASEWVDENYEAVIDGLLPVGYVEQVRPAVLTTNNSTDRYVLEITMRAEG